MSLSIKPFFTTLFIPKSLFFWNKPFNGINRYKCDYILDLLNIFSFLFFFRITTSDECRRRRYSETDCFSDDSFDSDVTWPPCTPRSHASSNNKQEPRISSRIEYYDHNNRYHSSSSRSRPTTCVTRLHHLQVCFIFRMYYIDI